MRSVTSRTSLTRPHHTNGLSWCPTWDCGAGCCEHSRDGTGNFKNCSVLTPTAFWCRTSDSWLSRPLVGAYHIFAQRRMFSILNIGNGTFSQMEEPIQTMEKQRQDGAPSPAHFLESVT